MAGNPLIPINTPFSYNVGINYESWENGRTGYSITADLNQITKYFGLIKTFHDVAVGTANPNNPIIDPTQKQVISYVAKTANVELVMGTLNNALFQGGFGSPWKPGLMTSSTYTDKWVQMIIGSFGGATQAQAHLKMILLGNEIDQNGPPPNDPSFGAYQVWIKQSFDNLGASLRKYGLASIPVSTTIANYGSANAVAVNISAYIQGHWSKSWDGGRPIVLYNQYTPATSKGPMSSTDFNPVIHYFESVYQQLGGRIEPFVGETGYSTFYGQTNQVKVYGQISAWLNGQYNAGHRTVPLFAFDAFDQPSRQPPVEVKFGIFAQNGSHQPTGLKPGLTLPPWTKTRISNGGNDRMALFSRAFSPEMTVAGGAGTDTLVLAEPQRVDLTTGQLVGLERLEGSSGDDTVTMTADEFVAFDDIDLGGGADVLKIVAQGAFALPAGSPVLNGIETLQLYGSAGNDVLQGGAGNDQLFGRAGNDTLAGGNGNDVPLGGSGADSLNGGAGIDRAQYSDAPAGLTADLQVAANNTGIAAGDAYISIENLAGSHYDDSLWGDGGANIIWGSDGNDRLFGRDGNDTLAGGNGNDTLAGGNGNDALLGGVGADSLDGGAGLDRAQYSDAPAGLVADLQVATNNTGIAAGDAYVSIENLAGSHDNDNLRGDAGANAILGLGGNDHLFGRDGNDTLAGGNGNDTLAGGNGSDVLLGGSGADSLDGGAGIDRAHYSDAPAGLTADLQVAANNTGIAAGDAYISIENLAGSHDDDSLRGDGGANTVWGLDGNDELFGRAGNDKLIGGNGNDRFVFDTALNALTNVDQITDFNVAADTMVLGNSIFATIAGTGTLSAAQFAASATGTAQDSDDRIVYQTTTGNLFFDSNGSAAGGSVLFAEISPGLALTNANFFRS